MKVRCPHQPQKAAGARAGGWEAAPELGSQLSLSPELSGTRHFKGPAQNYSTLLLEEASARLLVGARGALFSLNAHDIGDGAHKEVSPWHLDHSEVLQLHPAPWDLNFLEMLPAFQSPLVRQCCPSQPRSPLLSKLLLKLTPNPISPLPWSPITWSHR